ncbi:hypothetical protein FQN57_006574 [Myotisia sp. PD_48]|nr:hypothetical protein FQN57_006574 [Myotisia sp. PD_48]
MEFFKASSQAELATQDIVSWIFDAPQYDQDMPIYVDVHNPSNTISCNQARKYVRQIIAGLRAAGFKKGDTLNIHSFNDIFYSILCLAAIGAGGVFTGTNPSYTKTELTHHMKTARVGFLISEPEILQHALDASKDHGIPASRVWILNTGGREVPAGHRSWTELLTHGEQDWVRFDDEHTCRTTTAARLFSSGTTGLPKAVVITHQNFIAQHVAIYMNPPPPFPKLRQAVAVPCFHASAVPSVHVSALKAGNVQHILRRFELELFFKTIEKYNVNFISTVPPMAIAMIKSPLAKHPYLKGAKMGKVGAAPLDKALQAQFRSLMADDAPYTQVWGMTETTCVATAFPYPQADDTGSVGFPVANLEMRLVDDDGNNISAYDVRGEICVRGPTVTPGYYENPKANAESFDKDGFFKTGDIGYCDGKTKKWYIVDRKKELIKVRGFQVAPPEIEALLLSHPHVLEAGVIGVKYPDDDTTEHPRAYVVRQPVPEAQSLDEKTVLAYTEGKLAKYKTLTGGVKFMDALPKNPSGKILKRLLREEAQKEIAKEWSTPKL